MESARDVDLGTTSYFSPSNREVRSACFLLPKRREKIEGMIADEVEIETCNDRQLCLLDGAREQEGGRARNQTCGGFTTEDPHIHNNIKQQDNTYSHFYTSFSIHLRGCPALRLC